MKTITTSGRYVYGRDYLEPNQRALFQFNENRAGGVTPGNKMTIRQKMDGNEDAMAWIPLEDGRELWLLADSHLGRIAGELSVSAFQEHFKPQADQPALGLFNTHLALNEAVRLAKEENRQLPLNCATTLVSVLIEGDRATFCSTGDSHVFHVRNGRASDMFEPNPGLFVGDAGNGMRTLYRYLDDAGMVDAVTDEETLHAVYFELAQLISEEAMTEERVGEIMARVHALTKLKPNLPIHELTQAWHPLRVLLTRTLPVWGTLQLKPDDAILIASDGIDEETSNLTMKDIGKIFKKTEAPAQQQAEALLDKAMGKRGCDDNLMFLFGKF